MQDFKPPTHPDLLVGIDTRDDAGVYRLNEEQAIIQTLDFFTPMVDDPFLFGQIAAVNAINDVYAMGGTPLLAMNIVCFPAGEDLTILRQILDGGLSKIREAGALMVGGHSIDDNEPKYGLAVTGLVHPEQVLNNAGARPGDMIFLTKPIGNGILSTAIKAGMISESSYQEAIKWMTMLNASAASALKQVEVHALTDVTGFGLVGHLYEMAVGSQVKVELYADRVPLMEGALEYARMGLIPGGTYKNRAYLQEKFVGDQEVDPAILDLCFSPETAGGLLISAGEEQAQPLAAAMNKWQSECILIGRVIDKGFEPIQIRNY